MKTIFRYVFIFNPAANKGRAGRKAAWLSALVSARSDSLLLKTAYSGHAEKIARSEACSGTAIIACGGDGTLHEVVNAVAAKGVCFGILPMGSANDFIKTLNNKQTDQCGIAAVFAGECKSVDLGRVVFGYNDCRYFINSLGIGFTGRIAKIVRQATWMKGTFVYVYALLRVLVGYKPQRFRLTITLADSVRQLDEDIFAFSVANGKIEGGKFRIAPDADLSDGLLDVSILKAISKHQLFRYIIKYLRGTHIYDPNVLYCKAKSVEVVLRQPDVMHLDGEVFDQVSGRIAISVVPQSLSILQGIS